MQNLQHLEVQKVYTEIKRNGRIINSNWLYQYIVFRSGQTVEWGYQSRGQTSKSGIFHVHTFILSFDYVRDGSGQTFSSAISLTRPTSPLINLTFMP